MPRPYEPSPLMNESTGENVSGILNNYRFSRSDLHRILKSHGIPHNPGGTYDELMNVAQASGVTLNPIPPGKYKVQKRQDPDEPQEHKREAHEPLARKVEPKGQVEFAKDGWPRLVPVLKKYCKERGIPFGLRDKRPELVAKLQSYMESLNGENPAEHG